MKKEFLFLLIVGLMFLGIVVAEAEVFCDPGYTMTSWGGCELSVNLSCNDSDGGLNYYERGESVGYAYGNIDEIVNLIDHCFNDTDLNEGSCDNIGWVGWHSYKCSNGCENGACIGCLQAEYFCIPSLECPSSEDIGDDYYCARLSDTCCMTENDENCSAYGGIECNSDEVCTGNVRSTFDVDKCCIGACVDKISGVTSLNIISAGPNGIINVFSSFENIELYVQTSKSARCSYLFSEHGSMVEFFETGSIYHSQNLTLDVGEYIINISCEDDLRNERYFFTNFVVKLVDECLDSDGGKDYYVKGKTTGHMWNDNTTYVKKEDHCCEICDGYHPLDGADNLFEWHCEDGVISGFVWESCPNGCRDGACAKIEPDEKTGPIDIPEGISEEEISGICDGCLLDNQCYPFGYRKSERYCFDENEFVDYKESEESCDNNFECKSNVCVDGECVSGGLVRRIINWFIRLFGG